MKRAEDSIRDLWDHIKCTKIQIIEVPEEEGRKKGYKKIFEDIIVVNFSDMEKEIVSQVQEEQRAPYRRITPRHILIKLVNTKYKETMLKSAREKQQVTYKGNCIHLSADLSAETLQARREWKDIFKVLKRKYLQPRLLYPARISLKVDGEI